jgi:hypothetical protein
MLIYKYYGAPHLLLLKPAEVGDICISRGARHLQQQSCEIFVEIRILNKNQGAEHRNIILISIFLRLSFQQINISQLIYKYCGAMHH